MATLCKPRALLRPFRRFGSKSTPVDRWKTKHCPRTMVKQSRILCRGSSELRHSVIVRELKHTKSAKAIDFCLGQPSSHPLSSFGTDKQYHLLLRDPFPPQPLQTSYEYVPYTVPISIRTQKIVPQDGFDWVKNTVTTLSLFTVTSQSGAVRNAFSFQPLSTL